jgi:hypothetical protein
MNKLALSLVFILAGTSFVAYSFLDTFIIPKNVRDVNIDDNSDFSFFELPISSSTSSNKESSSSSEFSSSQGEESSSEPDSSYSFPDSSNISTNKYYENLTPEQIAALFTNEVVFREREHYSDPDIYINITTHRDEEDTTTYYVADVRLRSLRYFKTALAKDTYGMHIKERTSDICKRKKGILAINGDTYGEQEGGYVVRNGVPLRDTKNLNRMRGTTSKAEDLIIRGDGTFAVIDERYTSFEEVTAQNPWQVFSFGPALVKENEVSVNENEEVGVALSGNRNQRCAIGIISPNHYCFVVSDGRNSESSGISLFTLGTIMKNLHCETAYNLDGGGSATMYLDDGTGNANKLGHLVNTPGQLEGDKTVKQREVSDIVYIGKNQA